MNLIHRRVIDIWGGYYYSLNTDISSWNSDSINIAKLKETVVVAQLPIVDENATVGKKATVDNNATVGEKGNSEQKQHATVKTTRHSRRKRHSTVDENATPYII